MKQKTKNKWKESITFSEYLQLEGLMKLANDSYKFGEKCNETMNQIIGNKSTDHDKWTLLSDEYLQESPNLKGCLKLMGIKVKKK